LEPPKPIPSPTRDEGDFALALKLQQEEEAKLTAQNKKEDHTRSDQELALRLMEEDRQKHQTLQDNVKCQKCQKETSLEDIYILDECTHKFCQKCIRQYVEDQIQTTVNLCCPLPSCKKTLSVRDLKDLMPKKRKIDSKSTSLVPTKSSAKATERIHQELAHILKSNPKQQGYSVSPIDDNMYLWELKMFGFEKTELIQQDLAKLKQKHLLLHIRFPPTYPFNPPFVRVVRPRFAFRTGHVTIGGSICTELLTNKGWTPANTVEAVIMSIRAQFMEGGARLDLQNKTDYTEREAQEAFTRMVRTHGWDND